MIRIHHALFTAKECKAIVRAALDHPAEEAGIISANGERTVDYAQRRGSVIRTPALDWVLERLSGLTGARAPCETFQFAEYRPGDHFEWHDDNGADPAVGARHLSAIVVLETARSGGDLETESGRIALAPGDVAVFPACALTHRVTPVIAGRRRTLTVWYGVLAKPLKLIPSASFDVARWGAALIERAHGWANCDQVDGAKALYGAGVGNQLLLENHAALERALGVPVWPNASYLRLVGRGQRIERHTDRPGLDVTLSWVLHADRAWALEMETPDGALHRETTAAGDAWLMLGRLWPHARPDPYEGDAFLHILLHYAWTRDGIDPPDAATPDDVSIPHWHFPMMNDQTRNRAYRQAIERAVRVLPPDALVLDIGAGSGLLSMISAMAGAKQVVACERDSGIARSARDIIERNGLSERITVIEKDSRELTVGEDLPRHAGLLVTETFGSLLIDEAALPAIVHARARLLKPGAKVIPRAGAIQRRAGGVRRTPRGRGRELRPLGVQRALARVDAPSPRTHRPPPALGPVRDTPLRLRARRARTRRRACARDRSYPGRPVSRGRLLAQARARRGDHHHHRARGPLALMAPDRAGVLRTGSAREGTAPHRARRSRHGLDHVRADGGLTPRFHPLE